MKKFIFIMLLFPWVAHAAPGDTLFVANDIAYIHGAPAEEEVTVLKLKKNDQLTEIEARGNWVYVAVPGTEGIEGWILTSNTSQSRILEIPEGATNLKFEQFKLDLLTLDDQIKEEIVKGIYGPINYRGDGLVEVTVTNTWLKFNADERINNLRYLMFLWERQHKGGTPLTVQLVDTRGQKIMKTSLNRR